MGRVPFLGSFAAYERFAHCTANSLRIETRGEWFKSFHTSRKETRSAKQVVEPTSMFTNTTAY